MRRNESFFFALLAAIGALLLALMLLIGVWCSLRDAKEEIAAQQELIEDLKGKEHCATVAGYDFVGDILIAGVDGDEFADVPVTLKQAREMGLCKEG